MDDLRKVHESSIEVDVKCMEDFGYVGNKIFGRKITVEKSSNLNRSNVPRERTT